MATGNPTEALAKGAGFSFVGQIISTGIKYGAQIALAWFLGVDAFGIYTLGLAIYQLGELFSRLGLELGAVRYASIYQGNGDTRRLKGILLQAVGLPLLSGLCLGGILYLTADAIAQTFFDEPQLAGALRLFAFTIPIGASGTSAAFASTGFQTTKYRVYAWDLLLPLANLLLIVLFGEIGLGLWGTALAWLLASSVCLILTLYFLYRLFPDIINQRIQPIFESKRLLSFSLPLSFGTLLWLVLIWTDILMLGYFWPASEVGIYRAASQTAFLMILFNRSLIMMFSPMIANLYNQGDLKEMKQLFQTATRWNFSLTLPIFLVLAVTSKQILQIFGAEFGTGWLLLIILAAGQLTRAGAGGLAMHILTMSGHQYLKLYGDCLLAGINIALNFLLIPQWGAMGAAIATGLSMAGVNFIQLAQVKRILKIQVYSRNYLKPILAGAIAGLIGFVVQFWLNQFHFFLSTSISTLVITLLYVGLMLMFGLEEADRTILKKILNRFGLSTSKI
ncbi:oligosaccharide flippase family protein [Pleurocapsales cyanobacterium LEGE 06147]|nr:oligosaccharide flippase family protein [Pleurocapsales cyanobacterium LEGE 06147]